MKALPSAGGGHLLHPVEGAACLEPLDLLVVEGVVEQDGVGAAVAVAQHALQLGAGLEGLQSHDGDLVIGPHEIVVRLVVEGEREHALLLQVRLVDSKQIIVEYK